MQEVTGTEYEVIATKEEKKMVANLLIESTQIWQIIEQLSSTESKLRMVASNDNLFILESPLKFTQQLKIYDIRDAQENISKGEDIPVAPIRMFINSPIFTHMVTNPKGNLAFTDTNGTIYYFQDHSKIQTEIKNEEPYHLTMNNEHMRSQKAHKEPILRLYMDNDYIVSGSAAPTTKIWSIEKSFNPQLAPAQQEKDPILEQSHAYLFGYQDLHIMYGDWRWKDRLSHYWFPKESPRILNIVCKGPLYFDGSYNYKYENTAPATALSYEITIAPNTPLALPMCVQQGIGALGFLALYNPQTNEITCYGKNKQNGNNSLNKSKSLSGIPDSLQALYTKQIIYHGLNHDTLELLAPVPKQCLILITDKEVRLTSISEKSKGTSFEDLRLIPLNSDGAEITIKASAIKGSLLFLAVERQKQVWLCTINFEKELQKQVIKDKNVLSKLRQSFEAFKKELHGGLRN